MVKRRYWRKSAEGAPGDAGLQSCAKVRKTTAGLCRIVPVVNRLGRDSGNIPGLELEARFSSMGIVKPIQVEKRSFIVVREFNDRCTARGSECRDQLIHGWSIVWQREFPHVLLPCGCQNGHYVCACLKAKSSRFEECLELVEILHLPRQLP